VAEAERDGDVLRVHEDIDERLQVGDAKGVPPRAGQAPELCDDLPRRQGSGAPAGDLRPPDALA
jgi:hypothetical protein